MSEDYQVELDHEHAFDAAAVQDAIDARAVNERQITQQQIDTNAHAADFLGSDVDEYAAQVVPHNQVESYLELGDNQDPSAAVNGQTQAQIQYEAALSAETNAAATADVNHAADLVIEQFNVTQAQANAVLPPPTEDQSRAEALRGTVLYQSGAFANGAIGGIDRTAAASAQNAAIRDGQYPLDDAGIEPVENIEDVGPIDGESGTKKQSEEAVSAFSEHLVKKKR